MPLATPNISNYKPLYIQKGMSQIYELLQDFGLVTRRNPYPLLPAPKAPYAVDYADKDGVDEYTEHIAYQPIGFEVGFYIRAVDDSPSPEKTIGVMWDWAFTEVPEIQTFANFEGDNGISGHFELEFADVESAEELKELILRSYEGDIPLADFEVDVDDSRGEHYGITIKTQRRCSVYIPTEEEGAYPGGTVTDNLPKLSHEIVREKIDEFFGLVRDGYFKTYDSYTGVGYRLVRFDGFKEDVFMRTSEGKTYAMFAITFKANDPVTRIVFPLSRGVLSTAIYGVCADEDEGESKTATFGGGDPTAVNGTRFSVYFSQGWRDFASTLMNGIPVVNLPPMGIDEGEYLFEYNSRDEQFIYIDKL